MTRILAASLALALLWAAPARAEPSNGAQFTITLRVVYHPHISSVQIRPDGRNEAILHAIDGYDVTVTGGRLEPLATTNKPWKSAKVIADEGARTVTVTFAAR